MKVLIYNLTTGEITSEYFGPDESWVQAQLQEGEDYLEIADGSYPNSYIEVESKTIVDFPPKPDIYHKWDWSLKVWQPIETYLEAARKDGKATVNKDAGNKIILRYPTYRQVNYNREPTARATIEMNLWIDDVRAESNIATSSIDSATDLATIEGIVDGFKAYLASL